MLHSLATIINFCSNDYSFLGHCIEKMRPVSDQIIVSVCDHFFDGVPEDQELLNRIYAEYPDVQFIQFPLDQSRMAYAYYGNAYWHNIARLVGAYHIDTSVEYAFFLDCDEIADTERLSAWLKGFPYQNYTAIRFATYWYFREASLRALRWEDMPLLIRRDLLEGSYLMKPLQRSGMYDDAPGKTARMVSGLDTKPLFHHYSFVRTKEQMLRKVVSWGHNRDRDWVPEVEREFSAPFQGTDFVRGYDFEAVAPYVPIDLSAQPRQQQGVRFDNVRYLTASDVYKIEIVLTWNDLAT